MDNPGEFVRKVRERHKLTQAQLGALMGIAGNHIGLIERGIRRPTDQFLAHLELLDWKLNVEEAERNSGIIKESPDDPSPSLHHLSGRPRTLKVVRPM